MNKIDEMKEKYIGLNVDFQGNDEVNSFYGRIDNVSEDTDGSVYVTLVDMDDDAFDVDWKDINEDDIEFLDDIVTSEYSFVLRDDDEDMVLAEFVLCKEVDYENDGTTDFSIVVKSGHILEEEYSLVEETAINLHDGASSSSTFDGVDTTYLVSKVQD